MSDVVAALRGEPASVFREAARWLREHQWVQGRYGILANGQDFEPDDYNPFNDVDCACVIGAMALVSRTETASADLTDAVEILAKSLGYEETDSDIVPLNLQERWERVMGYVSIWNDEKGRALGEVLRALSEAARQLQ